jgi:hypothetical protein
MDGKHVRIQRPANTGSLYFNYKEFFSFVLFAIVDANYRFLYQEVGAPGRIGDATIWNHSAVKQAMENGTLNTPPPKATPNDPNTWIPSLLVADSAFSLSPTLMKPFPDRNITPDQRIFNYRLSRARRIVENSFGHLTNRFGIYQKPIRACPLTARKMVKATLVLHNFLRDNDRQYFGPRAVDTEDPVTHEVIRGEWRLEVPQDRVLHSLQPVAQRPSLSATAVRNSLKDYFNGAGAVSWQARN